MGKSSNVKLLNSVLDPDLKNASQKYMVDPAVFRIQIRNPDTDTGL